LFAWFGLAAVELATGDLRRTATIGASFAGTDACTGLAEHAVTGLMDVADAMTDPGKAARALLDLGGRPMLRVTADQVRSRLAAASLLFGAGDFHAAEDTIHDALTCCEAIDSPLAGACRIFLARLRRADGRHAAPGHGTALLPPGSGRC